jgi:type I restriction enzyme R subunit
MREYQVLAEINMMAGKHLRDQRLSMKGIPAKLRALVDDYLVSKGIEQTVKPISILDVDFQKQVNAHDRIKTKAAEIEHAIRHYLEVDLDDDPELQATFSEALAAILEQFKNNWQAIYEELEKLREEIKRTAKEPTYGLHRKKEMPFFRMFKRELFGEESLTEDDIATLVRLTQHIYIIVERELRLQGFWESIPARNKLKGEVQKTLLAKEFKNLPGIFEKWTHILSRIMEIAEKNKDVILYAEKFP